MALGLVAMLLAGAQGPAEGAAAAREALESAQAMLCAACDNDVDAEGVNRPMRRAVAAEGWMVRAEEALATSTAGGRAAALMAIARAREALEGLDEAAAISALEAAAAALAAPR